MGQIHNCDMFKFTRSRNVNTSSPDSTYSLVRQHRVRAVGRAAEQVAVGEFLFPGRRQQRVSRGQRVTRREVRSWRSTRSRHRGQRICTCTRKSTIITFFTGKTTAGKTSDEMNLQLWWFLVEFFSRCTQSRMSIVFSQIQFVNHLSCQISLSSKHISMTCFFCFDTTNASSS